MVVSVQGRGVADDHVGRVDRAAVGGVRDGSWIRRRPVAVRSDVARNIALRLPTLRGVGDQLDRSVRGSGEEVAGVDHQNGRPEVFAGVAVG
jgi:hypothetical protein